VDSSESPVTGRPAGGSAGRLGMILFLAALGVLFAASMVAYLVVRLRAPHWPPEGSPRLPAGLWVSTVLLLASSFTIREALDRVRRGAQTPLRSWLVVTFALGVAFLLSQILSWGNLVLAHHLPATANLYAFTFYMLSGLHGLHVLGGLVAMGIVLRNAYRSKYTPARHEGVSYLSMYWHFLDAVWLVMFVVLLIAS